MSKKQRDFPDLENVGGKTPPYNIEAEQSVLGAILLDNEVLHQVVLEVQKEDFFKKEHWLIFEKIQELSEAGKVVDIITLCDALSQNKSLEKVGGVVYITELFNFVPSTAHVHFHCKIIHKKALLRKLILVCGEVMKECYSSSQPVEDILDRAEQLILGIREKNIGRDYREIKDILKDSFKEIEKLYDAKGEIAGIPTGFVDLDKLTSGLHKSDFVVIAARPSMGKTSLVLDIARHVAQKEKFPTIIFSLETPAIQLCMRMICSTASVDAQRLRTGSLHERDFPKLYNAASVLSEAPIYIDDSPAISVMTIRAKCRRLKREVGIGLVIIDYLQLIQGIEGDTVSSRQQEISDISRSLKLLARELEVPLIALSQLNRSLESRPNKRPMLSDLRESGAIEQDGDLIAFIYRAEVYAKDDEEMDPNIEGIAEIIIGKQRNGPTGTVKLAFLKEHTSFRNLEYGGN